MEDRFDQICEDIADEVPHPEESHSTRVCSKMTQDRMTLLSHKIATAIDEEDHLMVVLGLRMLRHLADEMLELYAHSLSTDDKRAVLAGVKAHDDSHTKDRGYEVTSEGIIIVDLGAFLNRPAAASAPTDSGAQD